jgi:hypothetical protein
MVLLAASLLVAGGARAQSNGNVTFGGQWWTQNAPEAKYQEYRVIPRGGFLQDYVLREMNGRWAGATWGSNGLQNDQHNGLMVARGITFRLDGEYNGIPHLLSQVAKSPFTQVSPGVFTLPDSIQRLLQNAADTMGTSNAVQRTASGLYTARLADLLNGASRVALGTQTDVSKLRLRMRPAQGWQFEVKGTQRLKSGSLAYGTSFGIGSATATEVATPINQKMVDVDATGSWTHQKVKVLASFGTSQFTNRVSTVLVDNSRRLTGSLNKGSGVARLDMWPDNSVVRGRLSLAYELPHASILTVTAGISQGKQDDDLLPYTSNTALAYSSLDSLPARKADEKFTETVYDARLTGRPMDKLYGTLRFRTEKYEKKSGEFLFKGLSPYDASFTASPEENPLWGSSRTTIGLDLDYTLTHWASVSLLGEHKAREHDLREIEKDAENVFGGSLRLSPFDAFDLSGGLKYGQRKLDSINLEDYQDAGGLFVEPSGLRRFDVADRNQTTGNAQANWTVNDRIDVSAAWNGTIDDYVNSVYGLQRMENHMAWGEATLHATKALDLSGGYGFGQVLTRMASSEYSAPNRPDTASTMNWWVNERDRNVFIFTHADWKAKKNWVVRADYTFTRAMSEYRISNTTLVLNGSRRAPAADVPNTFYRSHDVLLEGRWLYSKTLEFGLRYDYMAFKVNDFAVQNVPLLGGSYTGVTFVPNAIYLGDSYQGYIAHRVSVVASKKF